MSSSAEGTWLWLWWWQAMRSPVGITCAVLLIVLIVLGAVMLRASVRLGDSGDDRPRRRLLADEGGTATIEFALILPVMLTIILLLVQTTLVMGGNLFVHYSAFAAARSAVVQIPADHPDEPANWFVDQRGGRNREAVRRAAATALLPVAGPRGNGGDQAWLSPGVTEGLAAMHRRLGEAEPFWVGDRMPGRMAYALQHTDVQVLRVDGGASAEQEDSAGWFGGGEFQAERLTNHKVGPRDAVAVHVEHQLHLSVPYVNHVFADGRTEWGGLTMELAARAMLTNFGLLDDLPERPTLRRIP